jgi:hypothetical protein
VPRPIPSAVARLHDGMGWGILKMLFTGPWRGAPKSSKLSKGGVRHADTNWVKQYESTAVRLATNRQGTSLDNAIETR